ncbi:hypothetical protein ACP70R_029881 [Stipagrostis hirtigluma subsp. patula]
MFPVLLSQSPLNLSAPVRGDGDGSWRSMVGESPAGCPAGSTSPVRCGRPGSLTFDTLRVRRREDTRSGAHLRHAAGRRRIGESPAGCLGDKRTPGVLSHARRAILCADNKGRSQLAPCFRSHFVEGDEQRFETRMVPASLFLMKTLSLDKENDDFTHLLEPQKVRYNPCDVSNDNPSMRWSPAARWADKTFEQCAAHLCRTVDGSKPCGSYAAQACLFLMPREKDLLLVPYCKDRDMEIIQWPPFLLDSKKWMKSDLVTQMIFKVVDDHRDILIKELNMSSLPIMNKKFVELLELLIKRLHLLTAKESAMDVPTNLDARRWISSFANSLFMVMSNAPKVRHMLPFFVLTPYYREDALFSSQALAEQNDDGVSILLYLQKKSTQMNGKISLKGCNARTKRNSGRRNNWKRNFAFKHHTGGQTLTRTGTCHLKDCAGVDLVDPLLAEVSESSMIRGTPLGIFERRQALYPWSGIQLAHLA